MLSSISYPQYFVAVVIITASYYLYVVFRYYQTEVNNIIHRNQRSAELFPNLKLESFPVMGQAKLDNGMSVTDGQELHFDSTSPDDADVLTTKITKSFSTEEMPSDSTKELVQEAGNLIDAFKDINNKPEFLTLLNILIDSYKRFKDDIDLPLTLSRIVKLSQDSLQFRVNLTDLQITSE